MRKRLPLLIAAALLAVPAAGASAAVTFVGAADTHSARVDFDLTGTTLTVTLINTSMTVATESTSGLTAVFWDSHTALPAGSTGGEETKVVADAKGGGGSSGGGSTQTFNFAVDIARQFDPVTNTFLPNNSIILGGTTPADLGFYSYTSGLKSAAGEIVAPGDYGVSCSAMGLFEMGLAIGDPTSSGTVDGPDGGLTPIVNTASPFSNGRKAGLNNAFVFSIFNVDPAFSLSDLYNVTFFYGTGTSSYSLPSGVPEPASLALLATGAAILLPARRKRI